MTIRTQRASIPGVYFITFTCCEWLPLIKESDAYDYVYKWFAYLKSRGHWVLAYVIMPNHVHWLVEFAPGESRSINAIIGNGKRFLAYGIVDRLKVFGKDELLGQLMSMVRPHEKSHGKIHHVFEPSFDWKHCFTDKFIIQKAHYIHANPVGKHWNLVTDPSDYSHSSTKYYKTGEIGLFEVKDYRKLLRVSA
jgi:REP element-mobilizing transposase RayT